MIWSSFVQNRLLDVMVFFSFRLKQVIRWCGLPSSKQVIGCRISFSFRPKHVIGCHILSFYGLSPSSQVFLVTPCHPDGYPEYLVVFLACISMPFHLNYHKFQVLSLSIFPQSLSHLTHHSKKYMSKKRVHAFIHNICYHLIASGTIFWSVYI